MSPSDRGRPPLKRERPALAGTGALENNNSRNLAAKARLPSPGQARARLPRQARRQFMREAVENIYVAPGRRPVRAEAVAAIAASIESLGLLVPITIRDVPGEVTMDDGEVVESAYHLVAGRHRLEAAKLLGWEDIECELVDASDRRARMYEIAENLHRADLTVLERSEQTADWLRLADEEDAEIKLAQVAPVYGKGGRGNEGGINAASKKLGIERTEAQRAAKIDGLAPEAKAEAKILHLDNNQSALANAGRQPTTEQQVRSLREHAAQRQQPPTSSTAPPPAAASTSMSWGGRSSLIGELAQVSRVLQGDVGRISEIPLIKRVALARGCLIALGVSVADLSQMEGRGP